MDDKAVSFSQRISRDFMGKPTDSQVFIDRRWVRFPFPPIPLIEDRPTLQLAQKLPLIADQCPMVEAFGELLRLATLGPAIEPPGQPLCQVAGLRGVVAVEQVD